MFAMKRVRNEGQFASFAVLRRQFAGEVVCVSSPVRIYRRTGTANTQQTVASNKTKPVRQDTEPQMDDHKP